MHSNNLNEVKQFKYFFRPSIFLTDSAAALCATRA